MFLQFLIVVLACAFQVHCFSSMPEMPSMLSPEQFDLDKYILQASDCIFKVICEIKEPMALKPIIDAFSDEVIKYAMSVVRKDVPDDMKNFCTLENIRSEAEWKSNALGKLCDYSKDDRNKLMNKWSEDFTEYGSKLCSDQSKLDDCESCAVANERNHEMHVEMIERKVCVIDNIIM